MPARHAGAAPVRHPQGAVQRHRHAVGNAAVLGQRHRRARIGDVAAGQVVVESGDLAGEGVDVVHGAPVGAPVHAVGVVDAAQAPGHGEVGLQAVQVAAGVGGAVDGDRAEPEAAGGVHLAVVEVGLGTVRLDVGHARLDATDRVEVIDSPKWSPPAVRPVPAAPRNRRTRRRRRGRRCRWRAGSGGRRRRTGRPSRASRSRHARPVLRPVRRAHQAPAPARAPA